jgi:hypothetical protein
MLVCPGAVGSPTCVGLKKTSVHLSVENKKKLRL